MILTEHSCRFLLVAQIMLKMCLRAALRKAAGSSSQLPAPSFQGHSFQLPVSSQDILLLRSERLLRRSAEGIPYVHSGVRRGRRVQLLCQGRRFLLANFGDSSGIRLGFQGDSNPNCGIQAFGQSSAHRFRLDFGRDSTQELPPYIILEWGNGESRGVFVEFY